MSQKSNGSAPRPLVIYGCGQTAVVLYTHLKAQQVPVAGFTIETAYWQAPDFLGLPLVPFEQVSEYFAPACHQMHIAVGYARLNRLRAERLAEVRAMVYPLFSYLSPTALLWDEFQPGPHCRIGERSVIGAGAMILEDTEAGAVYLAAAAHKLETPILNDVTLQDGGYLNHWEFSPAQIAAALRLGAESDADYLEVGYVDDGPVCPPP